MRAKANYKNKMASKCKTSLQMRHYANKYFVPVPCKHATNSDFHSGFTSFRSHVNRALVKVVSLVFTNDMSTNKKSIFSGDWSKQKKRDFLLNLLLFFTIKLLSSAYLDVNDCVRCSIAFFCVSIVFSFLCLNR